MLIKALFAFTVFTLFCSNIKAQQSSEVNLRFDPSSGQILLSLPGSEGVSSLTLPPVLVEGAAQRELVPLSGSENVFENQTIRFEWERSGSNAIAMTWSTRDRSAKPIELRVADNSNYYGGGERFQSINQKGYILPMASQDHPEDKGVTTYKPVPFYMSSRGYGIWVDSYSPGSFDLNGTDRFHCILRFTENRLRVVLIAGPGLARMLDTFTRLSGRPRVPPPWAFAPWKSRDVHKNRDEVLQDVELHRKHDLPASVLVIDSPWETGYNNFILNRTQFLEPEKMFAEIERQGFYAGLWLTPFVNSRNITDMKGIEPGPSSNFREAEKNGFLVKNRTGSVMIREWWKGEGGLVDFTDPAAVRWWHSQLDHTRHWRIVRAFKCDDGEGNFVGDAVFHDGTPASKMKNRYAELYLRAMQEYVDDRLATDGVLLTRPGFTGTHRYPIGWSGDNYADFSYANGLPSVIIAAQTAGLSGLPMFGHDIAGYFGRPTKELFIRWTQFGAFSPLMMVHMTSNLGPWDFDDETLAIYRKFAKLHTSLFPYIYEAAHEAQRSGMPIVRAMALAFPGEAGAAGHSYQYMFGPDLLVAPIYTGGTYRTVFLPGGEWIDFWTGRRLKGGNTLEAHAPLDRMPLFVRSGAVLPMLPSDIDTLVPRSERMSGEVVAIDDRRIIEVWPGESGSFTSWEGLAAEWKSDVKNSSLIIRTRTPARIAVHFKFREISGLSFKGAVLPCRYDKALSSTICDLGRVESMASLAW